MWSATGHLEAERSGPITFGQVERTPTNQNNGTAVSGLASEQLIRYTFQLTDASTIGGPVHIFNYTFTSCCKHAVCTGGFLYGALLNAFSIPLLAHRTLCCDNYPSDKVRVTLFTGVDRSSCLWYVCRLQYVTTAVIHTRFLQWKQISANKQKPFLRSKTFFL